MLVMVWVVVGILVLLLVMLAHMAFTYMRRTDGDSLD